MVHSPQIPRNLFAHVEYFSFRNYSESMELEHSDFLLHTVVSFCVVRMCPEFHSVLCAEHTSQLPEFFFCLHHIVKDAYPASLHFLCVDGVYVLFDS